MYDGIGGGVVVADAEGRILGRWTFTGAYTANDAELAGILEALKIAAGLPKPVEIRSDSHDAIKRAPASPGVRIEHGYRGDNTAHREARRLARKVLSRS